MDAPGRQQLSEQLGHLVSRDAELQGEHGCANAGVRAYRLEYCSGRESATAHLALFERHKRREKRVSLSFDGAEAVMKFLDKAGNECRVRRSGCWVAHTRQAAARRRVPGRARRR